ncbi:MAG: protein adenylyltransferase SelO [Limnohabitans sp.]
MTASACPPLQWTHRLLTLGSDFYTLQRPSPLAAPFWASRNTPLLHELGWPACLLKDDQLPALAGNALLSGSEPLSTVYSGHQFGVWAGQLGDGRALWLGEAASALGPQEIQLKGAGRTPYSRMGDGRAVLRSSIREYLCSEAMHGLGIPTTRALCLVASPEPVQRETLETAAVVTRVAPSFLRFGHFEHFAATQQLQALRQLADHVIEHHLPQARERATEWKGNVYAGLLDEVQHRTAHLLARWQAVGFCHGVMNTDNMSLLGLTLDYGPFQFMDGFDPNHICNHTDRQGRYAYARQPQIAYWNLYCLGQALVPLIGDADTTVEVIEGYKSAFPNALGDAMRAKLGLSGALAPQHLRETDWTLVEDLLELLAAERTDYTIFWRRLSQAMASGGWDFSHNRAWLSVDDLFLDRPRWQAWRTRYRERVGPVPPEPLGLAMLRTNPKFVLRNHLAETAIQRAREGDFGEVELMLQLLRSPFDEHPDQHEHAGFPPAWANQLEISCSS